MKKLFNILLMLFVVTSFAPRQSAQAQSLACDQDVIVQADDWLSKIDGVVVDPNTSYRVTVNSFLADGGDNFSVLPEGTDRLGGEVDLDALKSYFAANSPVTPGPQDRITQVP